jgi:hypothetical protein
MLDVHIGLSAPRDEWFSLLDTMYAAPEFAGGDSDPAVRNDFAGEESSRDATRVGAEPPLLVAEWAFRALLSHSREFHLVHAGALAFGDQGVLVVGPPFAGKTTLTLALVDEGLVYFSDDVGAVARVDGRLHPFRRRAGVRLPDGGRRYLFPGSPDENPGPTPAPCRLGWLFVLEAPRAPAAGVPGAWTLILDARLSGEAERIAGREDVRVIASSPWGGGVRLDFAVTTGAVLAGAVRDVLGDAGDGILYLGPTPRTWEPERAATPRVSALPAAEAAGEVMRHLLNRAGEADLRARFGANPHLRMLGEVLGWLSGVRAFRVLSGTPSGTARALKALVASG